MRRLWCDRVLLEGCMMHCKFLLEKKKEKKSGQLGTKKKERCTTAPTLRPSNPPSSSSPHPNLPPPPFPPFRPNKKSLTLLFSPTSQTRANAIRAREWAQATHGPQSPQCRAARAKVLESQAEAVALSAKYTAAMTAERKIGPGLNRLAMEVGFLREKEVLEEVARGRGRLRGGGDRGRGRGRGGGSLTDRANSSTPAPAVGVVRIEGRHGRPNGLHEYKKSAVTGHSNV